MYVQIELIFWVADRSESWPLSKFDQVKARPQERLAIPDSLRLGNETEEGMSNEAWCVVFCEV
jgi:hypothetical protein